jgi:hypothetical protein
MKLTSLALLVAIPFAAGCPNNDNGLGNDMNGGNHDMAGSSTQDFAGVDLRGADFAGVDFAGADFATNPNTAIKRVFIILMENSNWSNWSSASSTATYVKGTLLPMSSYATMYFNPAGNHPSLPNYLWLVGGTNFSVTGDGTPSQYHQSTTAHIFDQLEGAGKTWKSYAENIPDPTMCPLTDSGLFATKHVPAVFFDDVTNTNSATSTRCISHVRPYTELQTDLNNNTVPDFNFITPNLCDDAHGSFPDLTCIQGLTDLVAKGDTFLSQAVPMITGSAAFADGGLLLVVWDEGDNSTSDGPIGFIAVGAKVKGGGYNNSIKYDHSSTLRSVQEIFGLTPFLGAAATSNDLSDLFTSFP